ncbi:thioesterase family protein [uncultured Mycolicibacterium sp.]|uniref:thioesterase family protein n=1 Tax=uncultured Mycolicibacterium sp. TaxID=2320817 RepID=UPI00262C1146|nr:thioesterase family protein [uncultured Mycolicibacterium sp.]
MTESYYELVDPDDPVGERLRCTDLVRSTWTADIQHGAPPSALLVRALERCEPRADARLSRVLVDLLGPVPVAEPLWLRARRERAGRRIELVSAELLAPGPDGAPRPVARASGWRLQTLDTAALVHAPDPPLRPPAEGCDLDLGKHWDRNYLHSVEWRWLTRPLNDGAGESWLRPFVDVVKGEPLTPLQRLFAVADCANGIGTRLDTRDWTFLNTDLVVHLHRVPAGEWIGVRAETAYGPDGIGATLGTLYDETGPCAAIQQSVLVRPRR